MRLKIKLKLKIKNIINYICILFIIINLLCAFYLYLFLNKYIYETIIPDKELLVPKNDLFTSDIDMNKFESINQKYEKKLIPNKTEGMNNIFN